MSAWSVARRNKKDERNIMIYFTSDLHFFHENVIKYANRPFSTIEEMNHTLIENWNHTICADDDVYILGDVTMKGVEYATKALSQLKGRKYLIKGNHDRFAQSKQFDTNLLEWIKDYHELSYHNNRFILFHYPIEEWNGYFRGTIHLHGHQHNHADYNLNNLQNHIRKFDVGVDANNMCPVSIEDIITFFSTIESDVTI